MVLDTRYLFCRLLRAFEIETVCDVGSMDGADAMRFRKALPSANILAFEANPRNFSLMQADERLRAFGIRVLPLAPADRESSAPFYVVAADYAKGRDRYRRGISSLYRRSGPLDAVEVVPVTTVRLDEYLASQALAGTSIALWVDVEGAALEVIRGSAGVLHNVRLVHVEVETEPFIAAAQKLFADVERVMTEAGFVLVATDQPREVLQFNALYLRADDLRIAPHELTRHARRARLRRHLRRAVARVLPARLGVRLGLLAAETRCR